MKSIRSFSFFLLVLIGSIAFTACNPIVKPELLPVLTTTEVSVITQTSAISGGNITSDAGSRVTARGVCWSTKASPTIADSKTTDGAGIGSFTSSITELTAGTIYFVRAYASTSIGTGYGGVYQITTNELLPPELTTTEVSAIKQFTATCGGNITSNAGSSVSVRGVCWSTKASPTIADSKTTDGAGIGPFTSSITGLTAGTTYFVRAYATSSAGTGYGGAYSFTTPLLITFNPNLIYGSLTDIDGNIYKTITIGTQTWMAENLKTTKYNDGSLIPNVTDDIEWGSSLSPPAYCWYNNDDITYKNTYGALYNWYSVKTGKLAPTGWHVPSKAEWTTLENYLTTNGYNYDGTTSGNKIAKSLAATTDWCTCTGNGFIGNDLTKNNSTGFTALPGGDRYYYEGKAFFNIGNSGYWWTSTEYCTGYAWYRMMFSDADLLSEDFSQPCWFGYSVRCIRDN